MLDHEPLERMIKDIIKVAKERGAVMSSLGNKPYRWKLDDLEITVFDRSPVGPFDTIHGRGQVYYLRSGERGGVGHMMRVDLRVGSAEKLTVLHAEICGSNPS